MPRKTERIRPFRESTVGRGEIGGLLNLGPKSSAWLEAAGLRSLEQVRQLGPVGVCRKLMERGQPVSLLLAYAIEGGLAGVHWNAIPWEAKQSLRVEFARMKAEVRAGKAGRTLNVQR
jgi:DNA transformation protein